MRSGIFLKRSSAEARQFAAKGLVSGGVPGVGAALDGPGAATAAGTGVGSTEGRAKNVLWLNVGGLGSATVAGKIDAGVEADSQLQPILTA